MLFTTPIAEASDQPVWYLFGATVALACITLGLVIAGFRALRQLEFAREALEAGKKDRHVQVFFDMGHRWDGPEMVESLQEERLYDSRQLEKLFAKAYAPRSRNPFKEHAARRASTKTVTLLRVPNFFENLALIIKAGSLDLDFVNRDYGTVAKEGWKKWEPAMMELRKTDPHSYQEFQWLVDELAKLPDY